MSKVDEAFNLFKSKTDGKIATRELGRVMRSLGAMPTEAQLQTYAKEADPSGSGSIDAAAFKAVFDKASAANPSKQAFVDAFKIFDSKNAGSLTAAELRHLLTNLGEKLSDQELDAMLREIDVGQDGSINYTKLVETMLG